MAIWRVLSIWNSVTSPSLWKNPGHAPVEEKEIAELSKKESAGEFNDYLSKTKTEWLFHKVLSPLIKKGINGNETIPWCLFRKYLVISLI